MLLITVVLEESLSDAVSQDVEERFSSSSIVERDFFSLSVEQVAGGGS